MSILIGTAAAPAHQAPREPVMWTEMADPDPNFVAPPEPKRTARPLAKALAKPSIEEAMEIAGEAAGQAALLAEERAQRELNEANEAVCRSVAAARGSGIDHSEWERRCGL